MSGTEAPGRYETHPTVRPTLVWLALVVLVGAGATGLLTARPGVVGGEEVADPVVRAVLLLTVAGVVRFLVRAYVLRRTTYVLDGDEVTRRYRLLLRVHERTVPLGMVRSHELNQSRVENLLGYGSITLNQGLGDIELENVPDPERVHERVTALVGEE